jgi:hypothetical protein
MSSKTKDATWHITRSVVDIYTSRAVDDATMGAVWTITGFFACTITNDVTANTIEDALNIQRPTTKTKYRLTNSYK